MIGLERKAEALAQGRKERVTSAHLLAAIAALPGPASELLRERRLGADDLLRAARASSDDEKQPIRRAIEGAREVADHMRASEALALHLLIALIGDRRTAAHRALDQCGVDLRKLRLAAMNLALGLLGRQPLATRYERPAKPAQAASEASARPAPRRAATSSPRRRAQVVPPAEYCARRLEELAAAALAAPPEPESAPPPRAAETSSAPELGAERKKSFTLSRKQFPTLCRYGVNLTLAAARGELDRIVCRDAEVDHVLDVLAKRFANNPCLVGPSGVGKTRIVHALAQRLALEPAARRAAERGDDGLAQGGSAMVEPCIVIELSPAALVMGTGVRGGVAERMAALSREVESAAGRVVVFLDEIHQVFQGDGGEELASEFKLAISQSKLRCIGATTGDEYARSIEADPALARRFSVIDVEEPSREDAYLVLEALAPKFEAHHGVRYSEDALALAIAWSVQYVPGKALPDKAVSIVDLSGARARRRGLSEVGPEQVAEVVSERSGVPASRLLESDGERLLALEGSLAARVVGHRECLGAIARSVRRNAAGLGGKRPIGTFLLLGPTGVGKTETAKALAEALFFSDQAMTRVDLSEYSEPHAVARLIGAPPGYVGHEAGGQLTEAVRRRPYQVLLLDELEKAHPDVLESFLAVFDEGRMTDGRGRTVDFSHTLIVMTSNLGAGEVGGAAKQLGFQRNPAAARDYRERMIRRVREALAPELFNRIDEVLVYAPLERAEVCEIAERLLARLALTLQDTRGIRVEFDPSVVETLLASGGVDLTLGARPMQRTISRLVESPLAEMILRGELGDGDAVRARARAGQLEIEKRPFFTAAE